MKVLVTGGAGFIGSHLVDRLLGRGDEVVVLDNLSSGRAVNIQHLRTEHRFRFIEGSVLDRVTLQAALQGCSIIYHLAAVVGVKRVVDDPLTTIVTNVHGTEAVFEAALQNGCKIVQASSSEVYGKGNRFPLQEDDDRLLGPTQVTRWCYSVSKALDEHLAFAYARRGVPFVALRYFNTYGPRLDPQGYASVVMRFLAQALAGQPLTVYGDGQQTRCFTYVADTVQGTLLAAETPEAQGQILNIGSDRETRVIDLARLIIKITGSSSSIQPIPYPEVFGEHFEDPPRRVPSTAKASRLLGFRAEVPLEEGIRRTAQWLAEATGGRTQPLSSTKADQSSL